MQITSHASFPASRAAAPRISVAAPASGDAALRQQLLTRLGREDWWHAETANVYVADGTAILQGLFRRQSERRAARELVLATPGVRRVRDDRVRAREWQAMA